MGGGTRGAIAPRCAPPLGGSHPSGYGRSAHRVPFARETAIDNFWVSVFPGSGLTQTATSIYNHTGLAGLLSSTDCITGIPMHRAMQAAMRRLAAVGTADGRARGWRRRRHRHRLRLRLCACLHRHRLHAACSAAVQPMLMYALMFMFTCIACALHADSNRWVRSIAHAGTLSITPSSPSRLSAASGPAEWCGASS